MAFFPIMVDWQGMPCLIAGGGAVARHKAELLCAQGAAVTVIAPTVCPEILSLPVTLIRRQVCAGDVAGQVMVVDATGNKVAGEILREACQQAHIPYNSASGCIRGTVMFPAVHRKGRLILAVSGLGASPAASARIRDLLARQIPEKMDDILDAMAELRILSQQWFEKQANRRIFLHQCLDEMLRLERKLDVTETEAIRKRTEESTK